MCFCPGRGRRVCLRCTVDLKLRSARLRGHPGSQTSLMWSAVGRLPPPHSRSPPCSQGALWRASTCRTERPQQGWTSPSSLRSLPSCVLGTQTRFWLTGIWRVKAWRIIAQTPPPSPSRDQLRSTCVCYWSVSLTSDLIAKYIWCGSDALARTVINGLFSWQTCQEHD